ncbi:hypothetical protein [Sulfurospirillum arcachonense]|uniref:hypothetical protein n=1 Tax=Sulfurospirillum arcachonense TaxID=57666 RepID=UPI0004697830|nr:hypothetical protein [Sulfurospirillum arcachonense]
MQVNNTTLTSELSIFQQNTQANITQTNNEFEKQLINAIKTQKPEEPEKDEAVETFKEQLTSQGALKYIQNFNLEKIEKLLEEKRETLKATLGLDEATQPPLEGDARDSALATLDTMMSDYAKELQERMAAQTQLENNTKSPLSSLLS